MSLFDSIINEIKTEYKTNPNNIGWRFIVTSKTTLEKNNGILFLTLNPGGSVEPKDHASASCESGCAYLTEIWKGSDKPGESKLQEQFIGMFKEIAAKKNRSDYKKVLESSVCGYFIPFRSPDIKSLQDKKRCIDFSKTIWKKVLQNLYFEIIICIDKTTYKHVTGILTETGYEASEQKDFETGWGSYKASVSKFYKGKSGITLVRFPHLSRFAIFGNDKYSKNVNRVMNEIFS